MLHTPVLFANNFWEYELTDRLEDGLYLLQKNNGMLTIVEIRGEDAIDPETRNVEGTRLRIETLIKSGVTRYARIPIEEMWYE